MGIKIIASVSANGVIGNNNDLVLRDSEDLKRFKRLTNGQIVVMGRRTWESLGEVPLSNRWNVVVTSSKRTNPNLGILNPLFVSIEDIDDGVLDLKTDEVYDCWCIGGGQLYSKFMQFADEMYITRWNKEVEGDTYFPKIDAEVWKLKYKEYPTHTQDYVYEVWYNDTVRK